jgi:hypothetical protein
VQDHGMARRTERAVTSHATGATDELGDECEAFLAGRYAERLLREGRSVPPWAWLNQAAHADADTILAAAGGLPDDGNIVLWTDAQATIATLVLAATAWGADLREVQHEVLVPLELELTATILQPEDLTRRVFQALA